MCFATGACALSGCASSPPTPTAEPNTRTPSITPTPSHTPTPSLTPTPTFPRDALPEVEGLNVRAGPDTLHPIVGLAQAGTPLAVLGRTHDGSWLAVRDPANRSGWVHSGYLTLMKAYEALPTLPTPSPPPPPTPTAAPMDPALPAVLVPPAVAQGDPVLVRVRAPGARQVVALLDAAGIDLRPVDGERFAGYLPVPLSLPPGEHPVHITVIDPDGNAAPTSLPLVVGSGRHGMEIIHLDDDRRALVNSPARQAETERLATLWSAISPERRWQGTWTRPVTGTVSSHFGNQRDYAGTGTHTVHTGTDLRNGAGAPVRAAAGGRVVLAESLTVRGNSVWLDHGWGVLSGYFHLAELSVQVGQDVAAGQQVGTVGATGMVTGPHLHWEVRVHGIPVQPLQWLLRDYSAVP